VRRERLVEAFEKAGLPIAEHEPFECDPEEPPFPELVWLDWVLLPIDQLDAERHSGAIAAIAESRVEANPSAPLYVEGPSISIVELCDGAPMGILADDFFLWAEPPVPYVDYVFRGVSRQAQLPEPPVGPDDETDDEADGEARAHGERRLTRAQSLAPGAISLFTRRVARATCSMPDDRNVKSSEL
jgi:hypothetical protein